MKLITMHLISLILISVGTTTVAFVPLAAPYSSPVESIVRKVAPRAVSDLQSSSLFAFVHASANDDEEPKGRFSAVRATMRKSTGISLTAIRATMRAATGVSLTAMYLSVFGFTSQWVRESMKFVLSIFPPSFRYFLQPFLVLYYAPLFMLRTWTSPQLRRERRDMTSALREDWDRSLQAADAALKIDLDEDSNDA
mmetsp:Transcript_13730/g.20235  ORF Transcript_13730/g.20235 Transcript_13730/m.20235 type:complete len:196 (-) Transcript_13730:246-833(-)